ncbi:GTPase ObgE [candidate division WWE3 bacterium]|uniref:GTPase Obg n=1 Tax=candidate division WWE3 bacterium TaxID=2053526 RepID=A0A7X9HGP4_UNCKA|nr:GTPase ObgE [candidate division WWE3 bacterium]
MLIDVAQIKVKAGNGGDGQVSFRREKFIPKGGPDGGDGGKGGDVYIISDNNMATLMDFKSKNIFEATPGFVGGKKKMSGANGDDLYIKVPVGTLIYELKNGQEVLVSDLDTAQTQFLVARGGRGGKGNWRFRSSTNQTPTQYTEGVRGEVKTIKLEIKLVADIGLVGVPNAGKSTLLNLLTRSNAKVGDYPFTTLSPNLGILELPTLGHTVIADIPGLIEGAAEGKGLGDQFLRHVERTRMLLFIIDPLFDIKGDDYVTSSLNSYEMLRNELQQYNEKVIEKPALTIINKLDITEVLDSFEKIKKAFKDKYKISVIGISAASGKGRDDLLIAIEKELRQAPAREKFETVSPTKLYDPSNLPNRRMVFQTEKVKTKDVKKY